MKGGKLRLQKNFSSLKRLGAENPFYFSFADPANKKTGTGFEPFMLWEKFPLIVYITDWATKKIFGSWSGWRKKRLIRTHYLWHGKKNGFDFSSFSVLIQRYDYWHRLSQIQTLLYNFLFGRKYQTGTWYDTFAL